MSENISSDSYPLNGTQSVDKLKTIRPFTESQLLQLHAVNDLQDNDNFIDRFLRECRSVESTEFFQNIADLKRWRELLTKTRSQLTLITEECETVEHKVWELNLKNLKKRTRCADGRLVEGKHSYNEATLNKDRLKELEKNFQSIRNLVTNDYGNNFYNAQICQKVIENEIQLVVDENDLQLKNQKLKILISSLFSFQRYLEEVDSDFISLIKKWITDLVAVLLQDSNWEDHLFLLNHVLRCPGGVSSWATSFVQCKNPLLCADEAEAHLELNHCLIMISTILSPIKEREKFVGGDALAQNADVLTSSDDLWLMVDADVDEGEDVLINKLNLTETDIIRLLQQVPFEDILRYITRKPNMDESSASSLSGSVSHCQMSEIYMLKLLSISTKLIQILRQGLLTFNCMRFRTLTDYITSLIRKTVCAVSQFWQKCKRTVISEDQAMLLRLQVEYDHFILRSVVSILSSQRYGIWKFVSVIPFDGVTESMMWHIVWVFYNNGRDEIDELGGLCPYLSDAYWRAKFNEPAMKYLFQEKLPSLSASESECLLKSLANMIKSRSSNEIEFVNTIAVEMFEMGFLMSTVNDKMVKTCTELFAELSLQHPFFVSALIIKIRDSNCFNAQCIDLFEKMPLHLWIPEEHILHLLGDWLAKSALSTIFNRLSRLIISKMNWGLTCDQSALFFGIKYHRMMAIILYEAMFEQLKTQENLDLWNCCVFRGFDLNSLIYCAKSESKKHFVEFCWRICLILKLHLHNQPNWKKIPYVDFNEEKDENKFYPLPNINTDCDLLPIFKGLEIKNPLALYLTLMMTETGHSLSSYNANLELLTTLINEKNYIPALDVLQWFIPFYINKLEETLIDVKYIGAMNHLLLSEENEILKLAIGLIHYQFSHFIDIKKEIFTYWINLLCEILQVVLKQYSSSWFMASSKGLQQVTYLLDNIIMLMFTDDSFSNIVTDLLIQKTNEMQTLKLPSSGGWFSWGSHSRRSEWISPLHFMSDKAPDKVWFGWALIKSDVVKTEKIWEEILSEMNNNIDISVETAVKNVCTRMNAPLLPLSVLPINAWAKLAIDCPIDHVLMPLLWYNFFNCYFASIGTGGSMGLRVVGEALSKQLKLKLQTLIEHYHKLWVGFTTDSESESINDRPYANLTRLCRAFLLWLEDNHLHDAFVDVERLPLQYCTELLKSVMNNSESLIRNYVNEESLENQIQCFSNFWQEVKSLQGKITQLLKIISFFDFVNFSDIKPFLPPEYKDTNLKSIKIDEKELVNYKCSTILSLLQQHIRLLLEENKYFDNRLTKLSNLNAAYIELLSNNYDNLRKELTLKIPCDKDGYDPDGCTGPGIITFEFFEATENKQNSKLIERNKIDTSNLLSELYETPSDRAVSVAMYLIKCIPIIAKKDLAEENEHILQSLVSFYLSSISDANNIVFAATKHVFNTLLEYLNFEGETQKDSTSLFVLQTALNYPQTIQFLAPLLAPSNCSSSCFIKMYELLQKSIENTSSNVLFVLLSKFDVNGWLKLASETECKFFLHLLGNALSSLNKNPAEDKLVVLGLYRKHLQYMVIYQFPRYLEEVFEIVLSGMQNFTAFPLLWNDLLLSFGFYVPSPAVGSRTLITELKKYADTQPLFGASELNLLFTTLHHNFDSLKEQKPRLNLLEYFRDYVESFSIVITTLSFMWINVNSKEITNFQNVWNPFLNIWRPWIFTADAGQKVESTDFERIWNLFVACLEYFVQCFYGLSSCVLSLCWQLIGEYFVKSKHDVCKREKVIQEKLCELPWKRFVPTETDINLMYQTSQNEKSSPNILINKILSSVNWRNCIQFIAYDKLSQSMECLAYTIISVSPDPQNVSISEVPLQLVHSQNAYSICLLLRKKINLEYYFDKRDELMLMWLTMIKIISCIPISEEINGETVINELCNKRVIYANTVIGIIEDALKNDESFFRKKPNKLKVFIENVLDDISLVFKRSELNHRQNIFDMLLTFIKSLKDEEARMLLLSLIRSRIENEKSLILDFMSCACKQITDASLLINIIEHCVASFGGCEEAKLDALISHFNPKALLSDFNLSCIQNNAYLSLLLNYESRKQIAVQNAVIEMIDWCLQLKPTQNTEAKVAAIWFVVVRDAGENLTPDEISLPLFQVSIRFVKFLLGIVDEVVSQGFLSFMKFGRKSFTFRSTFISLSLAVILIKRIDELIASTHALHPELNNLAKTSLNKLQAMKKHKGFVEFSSLLDQVSNFYDESEVLVASIPHVRNWLLTYYSDVTYLSLILA